MATSELLLGNDILLPVAVGKSRFELSWKNKKMLWSELVARLATPTRTSETYAEYRKMGKPEQDNIKDVGGYVGGSLKNGRRKTGSVQERQLLTLDLDFAPADFFEGIELLADYACCVYSTHKHSAETPRFRLLVPLDRAVTPDEYEAIARMYASEIGIDSFDDTTYQPSRLMYWPSCSSNGSYYYEYIDNPFLSADRMLARYEDWTDTSYWPESSRAAGIKKKLADKQGDPCEKKGLIGAFCRTYTIPEAIEQFIPDAYAACGKEGRYTFTGGSTAAGLVIYDDGKFAYSNHGTDPAGGKLCNAFDLVRIHKFGELDEDAAADTSMLKLPSYKAITEFIQKDVGTKIQLAAEKEAEAREDFADEVNDTKWTGRLTYDRRGQLETTLDNLMLILEQDEKLKPIAFNQMADNLEMTGEVPWKHPNRFWRDADDAQLECYIARRYTEFPKTKIFTAIAKVTDDRSFHPIRKYLKELLEWDKKQRVDRLLIDYLGADDNDYVKAVMRKTLCAAVERVLNPGCKFDTMLVLNGPQGAGKSTLIRKLGGDWYSDSLSLADTKDKTAAEKLQGMWLMEIGELAGLKKTDVETLKGFLSRQDDKYRASYGHRVMSHLRQSVFIGTTNAKDGFLRDITGGRRFWPVDAPGQGRLKAWNITDEEVGQIWAEAFVLHKTEKLFIDDKRVEALADKARTGAFENDERSGMVREYLEKLLPDNWESLDIAERRDFLYGNDFGSKSGEGTVQREYVCNQEIWCECFKKTQADFEPRRAYEIAAIMVKMEGWEKFNASKRIPPYGLQRIYTRKKT